MRPRKTSTLSWLLLGILTAGAGSLTAQPALGQKPQQGVGYNSVYSSSTATTPSQAYIDASVFVTNGTGDVCAAINQALFSFDQYPVSGSDVGTVDARGIVPSSTACLHNPWNKPVGASGSWPPYAVVLLPAGTITIAETWVLPAQTTLVGMGPKATMLKWAGASSQDMIDMGTVATGFSSWCGGVICNSIVIEHLGLDGSGVGLNGIVNTLAQELSYVNDVVMQGIIGTGLTISTGPNTSNMAANSGPYTNITFVGSGLSPICVAISGSYADTRGVHGLNCTSSPQSSNPAVTIDSSNNSIEDVYINDFKVGIQVGKNSPAQNNALINISGGSDVPTLIDISSANGGGSQCPAGATVDNVCDLTILGSVSSGGTNIHDELTNSVLTDTSVGMYVLGQQVVQGTTTIGYSRLTTSTSVPSWYSGSGPAPAPPASCPVGSLYTCTVGSACPSTTLWGCRQASPLHFEWIAIK